MLDRLEPVTSITGVLPVRISPAPSTARAPTRTPSTTMQRDPTNAPSSTITGLGLDGLEDAADPHAAGQVHARADLRAGPHGRPRVHHRAGADPGADVHVARHQDDAGREERAVARRRGRHDADARRPRSRASAAAGRGTRTARPRSSPRSRTRK